MKPPSGNCCRFLLVSFSWITFLLYSWLLNLCSFWFSVYTIWICPDGYCSYIVFYPLNATNTTILSNDTLCPPSDPSFKDSNSDIFPKLVFCSATFSGMISYVCMMYALCTHFSVLEGTMNKFKKLFTNMWKKCNQKLESERKQLLPVYMSTSEVQHLTNDQSTSGVQLVINDQSISGVQLNPFYDNASDFNSTVLFSEQSCYYNFILFLNFFIFAASACIYFILFITFYSYEDCHAHTHLPLYITGLVSQYYSWFCAILSCFIFSKIAYAVINICNKQLYSSLEHVALKNFTLKRAQSDSQLLLSSSSSASRLNTDPTPNKYLEEFKKIDKWYTDTVKRSLQPFGTWFAVHWSMYMLSAFLSISYAIEFALQYGYFNFYFVLFSIGNCLLFLYPCFQAASVTAARHVLIKRVSKARWPNVPFEQKQLFIQFLKDENCTFNVSIFCTKLSFGFNVAFFSIFIGILGVVFKITHYS